MITNKELIEQFFVDERQHRRRWVVAVWVVVGLADLWAIGAYFNGLEMFIIVQGLAVFCALVLIFLWLSLQRKKPCRIA